jgi:hypothetical protein
MSRPGLDPGPVGGLGGVLGSRRGEVDERGPAAIDAAAEVFAVDTSRIATAISYFGDYAGDIDTEIADADEASARAEAAWRVQQQLIA